MKMSVEIKELIENLHHARKICELFEGEYLHHYFSPNQLNLELDQYINDLKFDNLEVINPIHSIFHPDSEWYDHTGTEGKDVGLLIYFIALNLCKNSSLSNITDLIHEFQHTANHTVKMFKARYKVSDVLEGWHKGLYEQTGSLRNDGIFFYAFHGIGLAAHFRTKKIDFDFCYLPHPDANGFDLYRLENFAGSQPIRYYNYLNSGNLKTDFTELVVNGIIQVPKLENSTNQYYFSEYLQKMQVTRPTNNAGL